MEIKPITKVYKKNQNTNAKILVFDRDDTLIVDAGKLNLIEMMHFTPNFSSLSRILKDADFLYAIASNQSAIGDGLFTYSEVENFNDALINRCRNELELEIAAVAICPHTKKDGCPCRKPGTEMLLDIQLKLNCNVVGFIGNTAADFETANKLRLPYFDFSKRVNEETFIDWLKYL